MNTLEQLQILKSETLLQIKVAAQNGEVDKIKAATSQLEEIENLEAQERSITSKIDQLQKGDKSEPEDRWSDPLTFQPHAPDADLSPRERGRRARKEMIDLLARDGVELRKLNGVLYRAPSGLTIGLPYASERRRGKWFLGLPQSKFDCAMLLCEHREGDVSSIFLPNKFFEEYGTDLSESDNQTKFNVSLKDDDYHLIVPGRGSINSAPFQASLDTLR